MMVVVQKPPQPIKRINYKNITNAAFSIAQKKGQVIVKSNSVIRAYFYKSCQLMPSDLKEPY